ncbi:MAG: hypothetical protein IT208_08260 [Chthonomonadales bacterium]|nr:hypothetical protein [Chthonomonadales bacterium]
MLRAALVAGLMALGPQASGAAASDAGPTLRGPGWRVVFSPRDGSLRAFARYRRTERELWRSGESGLWALRFRDGHVLEATRFSSADRAHRFTAATGGGVVTLRYVCDEAAVTVRAAAIREGLDVRAWVRPMRGEVLEVSLPGRLRFAPSHVRRVVCPMDGNQSVGAAFQRAFFERQPEAEPGAWTPRVEGPGGYASLYGDGLVERPVQDPPTALRVTDVGREWLGARAVARAEAEKAVVNRPPAPGQADLTLVDSPNGAYLSASRLGGAGRLWRLGGGVGERERGLALDLMTAVAGSLATRGAAGRTRVGVLRVTGGPSQGGWASVAPRAWVSALRAAMPGWQVVELHSAREWIEAARSGVYLLLLNPYGEWLPVPSGGGMAEAVRAVGEYVRGGGNWMEVGGYPFFAALRPARYLSYACTYPPAFADFLHLDSAGGSVSLYGVQPRPWAPWAGSTRPAAVFVPGRIGCGGDERGGYVERAFAADVHAGAMWQTPVVRLAFGATAERSLDRYAAANGLVRPMSAKMDARTLARLKRAVLVYYSGSAREKEAALPLLPRPALIHFADYLHGGFDKQYPDHLPPNPAFGTLADLASFVRRARAAGHLVMPYTNPTWWCDDPKGPTFRREGEAPLLRDLDGKLAMERYGDNTGFTVSHWHPAVRAANRRTREQFRQEIPVDVLFQDQCGARGWRYDTNPASRSPIAYTEGLLSMVDEDSRLIPLSTEGGWDGVLNAESQLCGMTWSLAPTVGGPEWRRFLKEQYPPRTWRIYPVAQRLAHARAIMLHHDLGQFVTNRRVLAWTLGLGFGLSARLDASDLRKDTAREWLRWLDRVQKSVCARYTGRPVTAFTHSQTARAEPDDDGLIHAGYGPVVVDANLGPAPRRVAGATLAPYGFRASAAGLLAGDADGQAAFVLEAGAGRADLWVYAPGGAKVTLPIARTVRRLRWLRWDGQVAGRVERQGTAAIRVRTPRRAADAPVVPAPGLRGVAPAHWPGPRPAVGVLDFPGVAPTWASAGPDAWVRAFEGSRMARQWSVPVRRIRAAADLRKALEAGPQAWLTIVNPYGEALPGASAADWGEALERLRAYVRGGGNWWETGGYSFHAAATGDGETAAVGPAGAARLGLSVGGGEVRQAPEPLRATAAAREWLGAALTSELARASAAVNRALSPDGPTPHLALVAGPSGDYIGGYRLGGWGWLWRIGGMNPPPSIAIPAAVAVTEHVFTHPPAPPLPGVTRYLWHAVLTRGASDGSRRSANRR